MTGPGTYQTIERTENSDNSGNNNDLEESKVDPEESEGEDLSKVNNSVSTDTLQDSRHTMARSKPGYTPGPLPDLAAVAAKAAANAAQAEAKAKAKHNEAVEWYVDDLGFPEPAANALYVEQTLTDLEILSTLANKSIDAI